MQTMNYCQYYKLRLNGEIKNNKTFIRDSRRKVKRKIIIINIKSYTSKYNKKIYKIIQRIFLH
jgi:hypothetical protein